MGDEPNAGRPGRQFVAASTGLVGGGLFAGWVGGDSQTANDGATVVADDSVAGQATAVDEGRVYGQRTRHQGPLINLFQLDTGARQCYPDQFDEWPTCVEGPDPEIPVAEQLFDHGRVATVLSDKP